MTTGRNLHWKSGLRGKSKFLVCEMSIQVYGQYGSTPRPRVPPAAARTRPRGRSTAGTPAWPLKGRRAYAHNGTAEGLALLSLVRL
jgi:hypothetical protein